MRILLIAYALKPNAGSEPYVGWQAVRALSQRHHLTVVTRPDNQESIEKSDLSWVHPPRFVYHGENITGSHTSLPGRFRVWTAYGRWMRTLPQTLSALHKSDPFDLVHHVTYVSCRPPSQAWKLGIPFVWGPIGGGEGFPIRLLGELAPATAAYELLRLLQNIRLQYSGALRDAVRHTAHIFACNPETEAMLARLRTGANGISRLPATYLPNDRLDAFTQSQRTFEGSTLNCFAGGSIEGRKGFSIAIKAIAEATRQGANLHFRIGGVGPELSKLQRLSQKLGLRDRVEFTGYLTGDAYLQALRQAHLYLLPSLRDNSPVTLMEAMAAGCVPLVADIGGPALFVDQDRGKKFPASPSITHALADALVHLHHNRTELKRLSQAAQSFACTTFTESAYLEAIDHVYHSLCGPKDDAPS